jgi:uncharacterized OsmC-like protein
MTPRIHLALEPGNAMSKQPSEPNAPMMSDAKSELDIFVKTNTDPASPRLLRCRTVAAGQFRQMNYVRDLPPYAIEQRLGPAGDDTVPTPPEALLAAVGSCIAVGIQANARARAVPIRSVSVDLEAEFDPTAAWGVVNSNPERIGFNTIRIIAHIEADAPRVVLEALLAHAVLWPPASNTLHNPVHIDASLA